jgi:hypothetical protein
MLALLWAPITSHCLFERLPGFEFLSCCVHEDASGPHEDEDCSADACAVVESGFYKLQDHEDLIVAAVELDDFSGQLLIQDVVTTLSRPRPTQSIGWQFSQRAALPIRAPSFLQ